MFDEIFFEDFLVAEIVHFLRDHKVTSGLNFIVSDEIADEQVTLQLRRVSFEQLIKAIEIATEGRVVIETVDGGDGTLYHVRRGPESRPPTQPILRVFNLSKFLAGKKEDEAQKALEDLHQTVEIAFKMLADAQRAAGRRFDSQNKINSKFHPGTKLMIVIGAPADVEVFHEVTSQLIGESRQGPRGMFGGLGGTGAKLDAFGRRLGVFGGDEGMGGGDVDAGGGAFGFDDETRKPRSGGNDLGVPGIAVRRGGR